MRPLMINSLTVVCVWKEFHIYFQHAMPSGLLSQRFKDAEHPEPGLWYS